MQFWNFIVNNSFMSKVPSYDLYLTSVLCDGAPAYTAMSVSFVTVLTYTYFYAVTQILVSILQLSVDVVVNSFTTSMVCSLVVSLKFIVLIALLVFIRGGIPRYRFDHLTKIGWIKFLSLVLASILVEMLLVWLL